tara:strand:- start:318 stop:944 length:627 start_codon:yes stop_codon:yes gene_type:complete
MIHLESCLDTLKRDVKYDYVLTSPPDYAELGIPAHTNEWEDFLHSWVSLLNPTNNLVTICTTDRKGDGRIYPKHIKVINVFEKNDWFLRKTNIWVKSYKVNMFRMNYMHILTFAKKPFKLKNPHMVDVILDEKSTIVDGFKFGMSMLVVKMMIDNHTKENDIVYDPFMGSGTTAIAAKELNREYLGSEISQEYYDISKKRIETNLTLL